MNGHPHYKPKGVRTPGTGLFPMHEGFTNETIDKTTHSHYVDVWDTPVKDLRTHTHTYSNRPHTHDLTTKSNGVNHTESYGEAFGWKAKE